MSYNYPSFITAFVAAVNIPISNAALAAYMPSIIDSAEGMIYREPKLDFLSSTVTDDTGFTTNSSRNFTLPRSFTILESVNLVDGNDRPPLVKISREAMDSLFTQRTAAPPGQLPLKWAPFDDEVILLGPIPGGIFQLECTGKARPANLSADNPTTWLWSNLGDFAFAAAMYFAAGYMRNFGAQADDPKMAVSWRDTYDKLLQGAEIEEIRRKYEATVGTV